MAEIGGKDIGYYERLGGPVYGPGNWPKDWTDAIEQNLDNYLDNYLKSSRPSNSKEVYINCYEVGSEDDPNKGTLYESEYAKKFLEPHLFGTQHPQLTYHGLGRGAGPIEPMNMYYIQLEPRVKFFKPPLTIKIFKWEINMTWAYEIYKACLLKDCKLVSSNYKPKDDEPINDTSAKKMMRALASDDEEDDHCFTLEWKSTPIENPIINQMAEDLKKKIDKLKGGC